MCGIEFREESMKPRGPEDSPSERCSLGLAWWPWRWREMWSKARGIWEVEFTRLGNKLGDGCGGRTSGWLPVTPASWCSRACVFEPSPWAWAGPVTCFQPTEHGNSNGMSLRGLLYCFSLGSRPSSGPHPGWFWEGELPRGEAHVARNNVWQTASKEPRPSVQ